MTARGAASVLREDGTTRQTLLASPASNDALARLIDHTLLKPGSSTPQVEALCKEAVDHQFRSVCVAPCHVRQAAELLRSSPSVAVCTVVGFPNGTSTISSKVFETRDAIERGATEIDFVQNANFVKDKQWDELQQEYREIVAAASPYLVKVILETSLLSEEEIVACAKHAVACGVHVVKTSTGFGSRGASRRDIELIANAINETGSTLTGIKASGGVATREDALMMVTLGATRIGTSKGVALSTGAKLSISSKY